MTTEAGSETEVKENAEESAAQPDQSEKAKQESQEVANAEGEEKEKEKEKDGKGITRYLPTWFKKQKSQSQVMNSDTDVTVQHYQKCLLRLTDFFFPNPFRPPRLKKSSPQRNLIARRQRKRTALSQK